MYEVVAEPQEPQGQALQQEDREEPAQFTLALSSRRKASPGACPIIFKIMTPIYVSINCALGLEIAWNPSCMISRFP